MKEILTLKVLLETCESLPWDHSFYVSKQTPWGLNMPAIVWDQEDIEDDNQDEPEAIEKLGMKYVLSIRDLQSIASNLGSQVGAFSIDELYEALTYYLKHDAFIEHAG